LFIAIRTRSGLLSLVFKKILRKKALNASVGEVSTSVNLRFCNVDYLKEIAGIKIPCILNIRNKANNFVYLLEKISIS